ncbi:MAG: glycosyltransferase family 39 protein [Candidatus Dadabacteria bacterium]|nr:MAG: glycosyltransferase family 39 protein [Candidatus Dadabacteria bacterium]
MAVTGWDRAAHKATATPLAQDGPSRKQRRRVLAGLAVAACAILVVGLRLGGHALLDPDESKHAEVAREMLVTGNWIEPQIAFQPYHHKPSLLYWLIAGCYRAFGVNEWSARLVPAAACCLTLLAVYWYASARVIGEGLLAVLLLGCSPMFLEVGRFTNFDALVTLWTATAALYLAWWLERGKEGPILPFYALIGLGVLAKGPMAAAITLVPLAVPLGTGDLRLGELRLGRGAAVLAAVVSSWAAPVALGAPRYLIDFLWVHNVQRYLVPKAAFHPQPVYFFVPVLLAALLPWSVLLPWVIEWSWRERGASRWLAAYACWVVIFFSLSSGKLATYVLPAFPAFAVLTARWLFAEAPARRGARFPRALLLIAAGLLVLAPLAGGLALAREAAQLARYSLLLLPAAATGAWALSSGRRWETRRFVTVLSGGLLASLVLLHAAGGGVASYLSSDADLAAVARRIGRPDRVVAFGVRPYSFLFYTRWPLVYQVGDDEYRRALRAPGRTLVLTKDKRLERLAQIAGPIEFEEIARNHRHLLAWARPRGTGEEGQ